jgi:hypothetical protein
MVKQAFRDDRFGTTKRYAAALGAVIDEGVPEKHVELLRAHFEAPGHIATARELARAVGYLNYNSVNLQYGRLAHRVANRLAIFKKPVCPRARGRNKGFWLYVLVDWAAEQSGDTRFVLRRPVIEALQRLGYRMKPASSGPARSRYRAARRIRDR